MTSESRSKRGMVRYKDVFCLLLSGAALGWLVGLSVSPVLQVIVGGIVATALAAIGALAGLNIDPRTSSGTAVKSDTEMIAHTYVRNLKVSLLPLTLFTVALSSGASMGMLARTNSVFGPNPRIFAYQWSQAGLNEAQLKQRLFDHLYPPAQLPGNPPKESSHEIPGLFSKVTTPCQLLDLRSGSDLKSELDALGDQNERIRSSVALCRNDDCLLAIKELLCPGR